MSTSNKRWMRRLVKGLALACVILAVAGFSYEQIGRWRNQQHKFRIGRPVDIGGRTLNIDCAGDGQPAVILESGGGGYGGYGWRKVQTEVAKFTKVCWYDHAGEGWSDPPPIARSSETMVRDLHELLQRTPVASPYVLVGHSIGGSYVRVFTARYPAEVAGVVLVDSSHPDQQEPAIMLSPINRAPLLARKLLCSAVPLLGRFGIIRFAMRNEPVAVPPAFASEGNSAIRAMRGQRAEAVEADMAQGCAATENGSIPFDGGSGNPEIDQAARSAGNLGDRPLVVLTAGQYWKPHDPAAAQEIAKFHEIWVHQLQVDLIRLSTHGQQIIVENSDHGIPDQAPDAVVAAVREIVIELRRRQPQ